MKHQSIKGLIISYWFLEQEWFTAEFFHEESFIIEIFSEDENMQKISTHLIMIGWVLIAQLSLHQELLFWKIILIHVCLLMITSFINSITRYSFLTSISWTWTTIVQWMHQSETEHVDCINLLHRNLACKCKRKRKSVFIYSLHTAAPRH